MTSDHWGRALAFLGSGCPLPASLAWCGRRYGCLHCVFSTPLFRLCMRSFYLSHLLLRDFFSQHTPFSFMKPLQWSLLILPPVNRENGNFSASSSSCALLHAVTEPLLAGQCWFLSSLAPRTISKGWHFVNPGIINHHQCFYFNSSVYIVLKRFRSCELLCVTVEDKDADILPDHKILCSSSSFLGGLNNFGLKSAQK